MIVIPMKRDVFTVTYSAVPVTALLFSFYASNEAGDTSNMKKVSQHR